MTSTGPVSLINFRTSIAAVNNNSHLRVYSQDVNGGIRESIYESSWTGGAKVLTSGKQASPIAATSKALANIRLYYLTTGNVLSEYAYDDGTGWYKGAIDAKGFHVAPYSNIAAAFLAVSGLQLRVYVQLPDNTIQEYGYDSPTTGWQKMTNLGVALPGSSIATTSFSGPAGLSIRVYFQTANLALIEKAYDNNKGWYTGDFSVPTAIPRASIAVTSFNASSSGVSLRVYYSGPSNVLLEKAYDGSWYDGGFKISSIPGSQVAVISWPGPQIRVYFQNGTLITAVTEWVWSGGWMAGQNALPPA